MYAERVPDDTTLIRWARCVGPQTVARLHDRVVELARRAKVTRGRTLRVDGTVVETTIHYPTDSSLLADGVRVVSRLLRRAKALVGRGAAGAVFRDRTRSATRLARQIQETVRRRGPLAEGSRRAGYRRLAQVANRSVRQARQLHAALVQRARALTRSSRVGVVAAAQVARAARVGAALARLVPLVERVIDQTVRRVLRGETVPAAEKLVSLFEPHTRVIHRGKVRVPAEFGRKVFLDEADGGIITRCAVLEGNPPEAAQVPASLAHHQRVFGRPPAVLAGDRGTHSFANEQAARAAGVRHVALPKPGAQTPARRGLEQQRWFRRAHRFRAGVEGRISVCKRRGWLGRCRDHGEAGFHRWIGWGILTANLTTIARTTASRTTTR